MKTLLFLLGLLPTVTYAIDAPVVDIAATTDGDSVYVTLSWDSISEATSYGVYYKSNLHDNFLLLNHVFENSYEYSISTEWDWNQSPDVLGYFSVTSDSISMAISGMTEIPSGAFVMGQSGVATPEHLATLSHSYLIGITEVTNQQYLDALNWALSQSLVVFSEDYLCQSGTLMPLMWLGDGDFEIRFNSIIQQFELVTCSTIYEWGGGPGYAYPNGYDPADHPVKNVTWFGAACFCDWVSLMQGMVPYYQNYWSQIPFPRNPYQSTGFRLPTEAEWEFAAQYDDERTYPWGNTYPTCGIANWNPWPVCVGWTSAVGTYSNDITFHGLKDMGGNVHEWTNDRYSDYASNSIVDPYGAISGGYRIIRGGEWASQQGNIPLTCANRKSAHVSESSPWLGFRLCKSLIR